MADNDVRLSLIPLNERRPEACLESTGPHDPGYISVALAWRGGQEFRAPERRDIAQWAEFFTRTAGIPEPQRVLVQKTSQYDTNNPAERPLDPKESVDFLQIVLRHVGDTPITRELSTFVMDGLTRHINQIYNLRRRAQRAVASLQP